MAPFSSITAGLPTLVVLDMSYVIAVFADHDEHHAAAAALAPVTEASRTRFVTMCVVLFTADRHFEQAGYRALLRPAP